MGLLSVQKFNEMQTLRKEKFLTNLDTSNLSTASIQRMCNNYFPTFTQKRGYVTFDDKTCSTELRYYPKKPY